MVELRSRITAWLGRRQLAKLSKKGLDLSNMAFLPKSALMPLRRHDLDPVPELGELREQAPVSKLPLPFGFTAWLVTGYEEAKIVLGKTSEYSNDFSNLVGNTGLTAEQDPGGLGFSDPPQHTKLRKVLTPEFTVRRLSRLVPRIQSIVDEQLDIMEQQEGPVDLVKYFATTIPSLSICELMGVPYEDRGEFQRLSMARFDLFGGASASLGAISESVASLMEMIDKYRSAPGDGLLGMIIKEHGHELSNRELAGIADGLLTGGFETTASMLAMGALILLRSPEHRRLLSEDLEAIDPFVEELLRYLTVVQVAFPRFARDDLELGGVTITKGDIVLCSLSGANRDSALGPDMETFDPHRSMPASHLAFGHGIHRCIGAELARMELRAAYPSLVKRFPNMRLAIDEKDLDFRQMSIVYAVNSLPVFLH